MTLPESDSESGRTSSRQAKRSKPDRLLGRNSLRGTPALVTMMKATDPPDRENRAGIGGLYVARFGAIFLQS
jgi:hypothetical protein